MTHRRCAIYTRKSTEEGLDQTFNSLDAQWEACEAFIVSQRHEGWQLVRKAYDDIVVYKIDRLTRSLTDFAKMVEVFDAKAVSFVSVTQQFNTTTSMGRLTLNVLLSFAQFEREVTAERIRDKIAASRKKGMWMGGSPPLGYDVKDKKLAVNEAEAKTVRRLFEAYLNLGSTKALAAWARSEGITTKIRQRSDGNIRSGGRAFSRGNLHALLNYRTYIGEVTHKGNAYPGEQVAI
ncbi:MAG: recombinase family protein, partial [Rhizobiales bacterium]|nr:recombinase family protein [Hyphomicrobiales bacterium]